MRSQLGLSLAEILISLFLSTLISTALFQLYSANKKHYDEMRHILESRLEVQWLSDLLTASVRQAGFTPCCRIEHLDAVDRRVAPSDLKGLHIATSITVKRMSAHFSELLAVIDSSHLLLPFSSAIYPHQTIILADCDHAEIHRITQVEKSSQGFIVTLAKPLWFDFPALTYVGEWLEERWFIKKNSFGVDTLYYHNQHSEELSSLIHSLEVKESLIDKHQVLDIVLGLDDAKQHQLSVVVRSL